MGFKVLRVIVSMVSLETRDRRPGRVDTRLLVVVRAEAHVNVAPKNITLATLTEQD